ncbi:hypothetical protein [Massilia sp. HP4]|uniref:hypothetical protein n=1 Tax=Massilia sp. HP4 TaxID=2562316 RepID=UPI0010C09F0B|nr:hypothetical protein [Massilia sp. HP4]
MGWFLVSILLPLAAPIAAMWVLQRCRLPVPWTQKSLLVPIKDGQLCWGAVAFCALAMYEIAEPGAGGTLVAEGLRGYANAGFVLIMVPSAMMAAAGAVFPISVASPLIGPWYKYYETLATSLTLTILAGGAYTVVNFCLLKPGLT